MNKEQLLDVLLDLGLTEAYDDLYNEDVTVRDWVSRNEDLVRSNRAIAQAVHADAPHDVKEGYFNDKDEQSKYDAGEKKYNEERTKKQQLADEYQRAKDVKDFAKLRADKGILGNLAALGMKLTPQAAKNVYIKEGYSGYSPYKIGAHAGFGTVANLAEFIPGAGAASKAVASFAGPGIRALQDIYDDKGASEVAKNLAFDAGMNSLFTYMPVNEVYQYVKRILGKGGGGVAGSGGVAGGKVIKNKADDIFEQADLLENKKATLKNLSEQEKMLDQFQEVYKDMSDLERAKFIKDMKNTHPELAAAIEENINVLGANRFHSETADLLADNLDWNAYRKSFIEDFPKELGGPKKAEQAFEALNAPDLLAGLEKESAKRIPETAKNVNSKFITAKRRTAEKKAAINDELFDEAGNLKSNVDNLAEAAAYVQPHILSQIIAESAPAIRAGARNRVATSRKSAAPEDKEYRSAIEYIIQSNKRQWNAGFKPRGGVELEAWQIAKDRGEI